MHGVGDLFPTELVLYRFVALSYERLVDINRIYQ